jgi:hypothetical protein
MTLKEELESLFNIALEEIRLKAATDFKKLDLEQQLRQAVKKRQRYYDIVCIHYEDADYRTQWMKEIEHFCNVNKLKHQKVTDDSPHHTRIFIMPG